jgi:hypothetical protein
VVRTKTHSYRFLRGFYGRNGTVFTLLNVPAHVVSCSGDIMMCHVPRAPRVPFVALMLVMACHFRPRGLAWVARSPNAAFCKICLQVC